MFLRKSKFFVNNLIHPSKTIRKSLLLPTRHYFADSVHSKDSESEFVRIIASITKDNFYQQPVQLQNNFNTIFEQLNKNPSNTVKRFIIFINALKSNFFRNERVESYKVIQNCIKEHIKYNTQLSQYFNNLPKIISTFSLEDKLKNVPCIQFVSEEYQKDLIESYIPYLHLMNERTILTFINDATLNNYDISFNFFQALYSKTKIGECNEIYGRYNFHQFINKYLPFYDPIIFSVKLFQHIDKMADFSQEKMSILTQLMNKESLRSAHEHNNYLFKDLRSLNLGLNKLYLKSDHSLTKIIMSFVKFIPNQRLVKKFISQYKVGDTKEQIECVIQIFRRIVKFHKPVLVYSVEECPLLQFSKKTMKNIEVFLNKIAPLQPMAMFLIGYNDFLIDYQNLFEEKKNIYLDLFQKTSKNIKIHDEETLTMLKILQNIQIEDLQNLGWQKLFEELSSLQELTGTEKDEILCEVVIYLFKITKRRDFFTQFYWKIFSPYIHKNRNPQPSLVQMNNMMEKYILKFVNQLNLEDENELKVVEEFINNKFISTVKSIIKEEIGQFLTFFYKFPSINLKIYQYLYNNLSTFVIFDFEKKKFLLSKGNDEYLEELYYQILIQAIDRKQVLKKIKNKQCFYLLDKFAEYFFQKLSKKQILSLIQIFERPHNLSNDFLHLFRKLQFNINQLSIFDNVVLANFYVHNASIELLLNQNKSESVSKYVRNIQHLNQCNEQELKRIFKIPQFYELAMESTDFMNENKIPVPETSKQKYHMIYVCLKIYKKISSMTSFSLREKEQHFVDLQEELNYVKKNKLVKLDSENEFKLGNPPENRYKLFEGWKKFDTDSGSMININHFTPLSTSEQQNSYERILHSFFGNVEEIKKACKKQSFQPELLIVAHRLNLQIFPNGSIVELRKDGFSIYIISSSEKNHKLNIVAAYVMNQSGYETYVVKEDFDKKNLISDLKKKFSIQNIEEKDESQSESEYETILKPKNKKRRI